MVFVSGRWYALVMTNTSSAVQVSLWQRAASYAARAHEHQYRKDKKTPYIAHPVRVALVVGQVFGCRDEVALCTALLHDTIEDTRTDYDAIEKRFGREIADCVATLTKNMLLREPKREADYDKRLAAGSWQARLVKLADVYDNGLDIPKESMKPKCIDRCKRALELSVGDIDHEEVVVARQAVAGVLAALQAD